MRRIPLMLLILFSMGMTSEVFATPINYGLEFKVEYYGSMPDPSVQLGDLYFGSFIVDDSILASDGINKLGVVSAFQVQIENLVWNSLLPAPLSLFHGFRGPAGLFSPSPGFDVLGGEIVNLRGGVFGESDSPFVDFSTDYRIAGNPGACGPGSGYCGNSPNAFWTNNVLGAFGGSMQVHRISEPTTLYVLAIGLLIMGLNTRPKGQPIEQRSRLIEIVR